MRFALPLLAAALAVTGCTDADDPDVEAEVIETDVAAGGLVGTYALAEIDGQPLPVFVGSYDDCREHAQAGTLEMAADGRYAFRATMREACAGEADETETESELGTYTVAGTTVTLVEESRERAAFNRYEDDDPTEMDDDIAIEDLGGTAQIDGDRLTVDLKQSSHTATFRRQ